MRTKRYVAAGDIVRVELPYSEVCVHMRVAGKRMLAEVRESGAWGHCIQLLRDDYQPFSSPILTGEAGFYREGNQLYCYTDDPLPPGVHCLGKPGYYHGADEDCPLCREANLHVNPDLPF